MGVRFRVEGLRFRVCGVLGLRLRVKVLGLILA